MHVLEIVLMMSATRCLQQALVGGMVAAINMFDAEPRVGVFSRQQSRRSAARMHGRVAKPLAKRVAMDANVAMLAESAVVLMLPMWLNRSHHTSKRSAARTLGKVAKSRASWVVTDAIAATGARCVVVLMSET
jgi:hypothetical protein